MKSHDTELFGKVLKRVHAEKCNFEVMVLTWSGKVVLLFETWVFWLFWVYICFLKKLDLVGGGEKVLGLK